MADVAADIDGVVATDGARGRGKRVGGTEDGCVNGLAKMSQGKKSRQHTAAGLDSITALPDHGADGARVHVY